MTTRTYLVALVDGGGTVPPELAAVRRLVERGHTVTVLAEDSMEPDVRASGAAFRPWRQAPNRPDRRPANDLSRDWECGNPLQLLNRLISTQLVGPAAGYTADVRDAIVAARPDLMVCSMFALGAMVAADAAAIPFHVLMPNVYLLPAEGMPPFGLGLRPARSALGRMRDRAFGGFIRRSWDAKGLPGLNRLRAEYGLTSLTTFWDQVHHAYRELVMTSPGFDFSARLPSPARYVGPVLDDPVWAAEPWTPPPGDEPFILVAMSSTFQNQIACLQRIADALGTLPVRALITTGPALDPSVIRPPANVSVAAAAPHLEVLKHADAVVTHGGHGTVMKSLAAGLPLVVMHHGRDQADNAARVIARGAGLSVRRTARPAVIAAAVRRILETPSYRACAARLGDAVRRDAESGALIRELEAMPGPTAPL
jgi:MGT family glycosyltransferase